MSSLTLKRSQGLIANSIKQSKGKSYLPFYLVAGGALAAYFYNDQNNNNNRFNGNKGFNKALLPLIGGSSFVNIASVPEGKTQSDYQKIYNDIALKVQENDEFDGGAGYYGILCRLAWHSSGTYDKKTNKGGSYGGTMIYSPENVDPDNAGLATARDFLVEFGEKYPWISRGDLWTLGGVVAIQEAGGPKILWRPGRNNYKCNENVPKIGNLPDATRDGKYVRQVFTRLGFNDQETVALIGAHCLGQCHKHSSGFDGPWVPAFNRFTNDFYIRLLGDWYPKVIESTGRHQFEDKETKSLMMLPTDMALKEESYFVKYVKAYANDEELFFKDFSKAFSRLLELGITYPENVKPMEFKSLEEQED